MKNIALIVLFLCCLTSCVQLDEYEVTIVYSIDDGEPKTKTINMEMTESCLPTYILDGKSLVVTGAYVNSNRLINSKMHNIISTEDGNIKISVLSFDYKKCDNLKE